MNKFNAETLEREMFQAVERNHRRAVLAAQAAQEEREEARADEMPTWACVLWTVVLAGLVVACMIYAGL